MKLKNKPHKERSPQGQNDNEVNVIQKYWRAFVARKELARLREEELKFLGIQKEPGDKSLLQRAEQQRLKIKQRQDGREKKLEDEKINIKHQIEKNESKIIKAKMMEQRRKWINKFLEIHEFSNLPNSLAQFYQQRDNPNTIE